MKTIYQVGVFPIAFKNWAGVGYPVGYFIYTYDKSPAESTVTLKGNQKITELRGKLENEKGVELIKDVGSEHETISFGKVMISCSGYVTPIKELKDQIIKILTTKGSLIINGKEAAYSLNKNPGYNKNIKNRMIMAESRLKEIIFNAVKKVYEEE